MIDINVTLLIQVVNLFVLIWLLNTVLYRPIRNMVAQRNQVMSAKRQDIAQADGEAASAVRHFEEKIHEARAAGRQKVQENKDAAYQQEKGLLQKASEQSASELAEMRAKIKKDVGAARKRLRAQIQAFSIDLAQKVLGRSI
jgi:F-type H+-transporting ATPase subunit b